MRFASVYRKFKDVEEFIFSMFDEAENDDENKTELEEMARFCCKVFLQAPLRALEKCHAAIDALWLTIQDLNYVEQARYLNVVADMLEIEYMHSCVERVINIRDTAKMAVAYDCRDGETPYDGFPSDIKHDYLQRDRNILAAIKVDDDLRDYIEKVLGKKAEDVFGYTMIFEGHG